MAHEAFIGNEKIVAGLTRTFASGQPAHGYLFTGPQGVGKRTIAEMCAALALCQEPSGMQPCGRCQSCGIRRSGIHPDFLTIQPHTDSPRIPIEDVRALRKFLSFTPAVGRFKIVVIDKAESLSDEGANALLKSLEEPPQQSVIILITAYPHAILPTIRSRLLLLRFQTIPAQALVLWLKKEFTSVSLENAYAIAKFSVGRPGRAKMLAQTPAEFSKEQTRWEEFSRFTRASPFEKLALLVSFKDREQFIHTRMSWSVAAHTILSSDPVKVSSLLPFFSALIAQDAVLPLDPTLNLEASLTYLN